MAAERAKDTEVLRPVDAPGVGALPTPLPPRREDGLWWTRYRTALERLPHDTRSVVDADARYIADGAIPVTVDGNLDVGSFGRDRVRTGIVVGSVQSGKTASMLAVSARLLDRGVDIIVVLAGTRVALWLQTYERLLSQLDGSTIHTAWIRNRDRVLCPQPEDVLGSTERVDPQRYLRGARRRFRDALAQSKPTIFVIPKEDDHLLALARFVGEHAAADSARARGRPFTLVVLDDEADDASILDAREAARITPQFIQYLWASDQSAPATRHEHLLATYVAYTATPQANYLQRSHNPLAPRSFHAALRVPADRGQLDPRSVTYAERKGLGAYYCGGDLYYERLRSLRGDLCVPYAFPKADPGESELSADARHASLRWRMIGDAMRSYFVGGAMRLVLGGRRLSQVPGIATTREALDGVLPAPHTMLYHPSALKEDHFAGAEDLAKWSRSLPGQETSAVLPVDRNGNALTALDPAGLATRVLAEEDAWRSWMESFNASASSLATLPGARTLPPISWQDVREALVNEVFPNVKLRVLNSDPRADDRPNFDPIAATPAADLWDPPRDVYTIFVAGNVLSRGLTLEGLCTSLFLRSSREPAADTQMQMQRWFGYRGTHLSFCRVFLFADQLDLFRRYHQTDVALKTEVMSHMDGDRAPFRDSVLVLQGDSFRATAKVDSLRVPLHPGASPSVRLVEPPGASLYDVNVDLLNELLADGVWKVLRFPDGVERGLIRTEPVTMLDAAAILERLRYTDHDPSKEGDLSLRWASLQRGLKLKEPLFRPPGLNPGAMLVDPSGCPYSIAAYLRLWHLGLSRHDMPGMQPTDKPTMPWSMLNLADYRATAPRFYLGVRFGSLGPTTRLRHEGAAVPMMRRGLAEGRSQLLETLWGSRNPTERWLGDQAFDYHFHGPEKAPKLLDEGAWRGRGQPGLMLFHPVAAPSGAETVAVGLAIPHGGPDHVAALRVGGRDK